MIGLDFVYVWPLVIIVSLFVFLHSLIACGLFPPFGWEKVFIFCLSFYLLYSADRDTPALSWSGFSRKGPGEGCLYILPYLFSPI
jgi:hypothetical protein